MKKNLLSSLLAACLGSGLFAQDIVNIDLTMNAGLSSLDNRGGWDFSKATLGVNGVADIGYAIKPRVDLVYVNVDEKRGSVNSAWQLAMDGQYNFGLYPDYPVDLYLFGGLGYEYVDGSRKGFENQFFLQGGAGVQYPVNQNFSLMTEFRALQMIDTSRHDEDNEFALVFGVTMPFHVEPRVAPDEDGDGVFNADDMCPHTPLGTKVDARGCPVVEKRPVLKPKPKPAPAAEVTEPLTPTKLHKRIPDEDGDGVEDRIDRCPHTPAGFDVDMHGCGVKKILEVHFESNSATLTPDSKAKIKAFADYMKRKPEVTVTIEGYTDSSGDMRHNMKLSQQRANAVKKALVAYGVQARRITAVGKGSLNPIADNDTPEGRAKNRRIEAVIHQ